MAAPRPHWADLITLTGLVLTVNEAVFRHGPERPGMQFLFLAMMGVSPAARIDDRRHQRQLDRQQAQAEEEGRRQQQEHARPPGRFGR